MSEKWSVLELSDGIVNIDLLRGCLKLRSWKPQTADLKDGGVWSDSPFSDGREILDDKYTNVVETFDMVASASSQKTVIYFLRLIRQLLIKARQYKTTKWQTSPVWIEARAYGESVSRYARIKNGRLPEDDEIFGRDFAERTNQRVVMQDLALVVEREPMWLSDKPGNSTVVSISAQQVYNGVTYGRSANSSGIYITNHHTKANLTNVYHYDASITTFSSNLIGAALPVAFLPATPAAGDIVYFGISVAVSVQYASFSSLVFDISQAAANCTITWEYYNGAAWVALTVTDNTTTFTVLGIKSVHWVIPSDWASTTINGVLGMWVRARVTAVGGGPIPPKQQNRDFYTIVTPYIQIASTQIGGDIEALAKIIALNVADGSASLKSNEVICAVRSTSRGSNFTPYINLADVQNITGITTTVNAGDTNWVSDIESPTGRVTTYTPGGVEALTLRTSAIIAASLTTEYIGKFHLFLRCRQTAGSAGDIRVQIKIARAGSILFSSEIKYTTQVSTTNIEALDFGLITLPGLTDVTGTWGNTYIEVFTGNSNAANPPLEMIDIVLMPIDEWICDSVDPILLTGIVNDVQIELDGISYPKNNRVSLTRFNSTSEIYNIYKTITSGPPVLQHDATQKLWFFQKRYSSGWKSIHELCDLVQLYKSQRYLSMRGET